MDNQHPNSAKTNKKLRLFRIFPRGCSSMPVLLVKNMDIAPGTRWRTVIVFAPDYFLHFFICCRDINYAI